MLKRATPWPLDGTMGISWRGSKWNVWGSPAARETPPARLRVHKAPDAPRGSERGVPVASRQRCSRGSKGQANVFLGCSVANTSTARQSAQESKTLQPAPALYQSCPCPVHSDLRRDRRCTRRVKLELDRTGGRTIGCTWSRLACIGTHPQMSRFSRGERTRCRPVEVVVHR